MDEYNKSSHTIYDIKYHIIWVTKYRYHVLNGNIALRVRELIRQGCNARGVNILQGSVGKEHIHLLVSCPPSMAPSKLVQYLKGKKYHIKEIAFDCWGAVQMVQNLEELGFTVVPFGQ